MRYWWYTANGSLYNPGGGMNLAPRQQLREWQGSKSRSDAQTARQVRDYRRRFPGKAILCSVEPANGWTVLAAGGSIPRLPPRTNARLRAALARMKPFETSELTDQQWALADPGKDYFVCSLTGGPVRLDLTDAEGSFAAYRIEPRTGECRPEMEVVRAGKVVALPDSAAGMNVFWLTRN